MRTTKTRRKPSNNNSVAKAAVPPQKPFGSFLAQKKRLFPSVEIIDVMRRYLMLSMFDGALTGFGIVAGNYFMGIFNSGATLSALIGAMVALAASSGLAAYEAESTFEDTKRPDTSSEDVVEVVSRIKERKRARLSIFYAVISHTLGPLPALIAASLPFLFFSSREASVYSLCIMGLSVFVFGVYVGAQRRRNSLWYGVKYLLIVLIIAGFLLMTSGR